MLGESQTGGTMNQTMKQLPESEKPYEKCIQQGEQTLSDAELLAVIIRTGTKGERILWRGGKQNAKNFAGFPNSRYKGKGTGVFDVVIWIPGLLWKESGCVV